MALLAVTAKMLPGVLGDTSAAGSVIVCGSPILVPGACLCGTEGPSGQRSASSRLTFAWEEPAGDLARLGPPKLCVKEVSGGAGQGGCAHHWSLLVFWFAGSLTCCVCDTTVAPAGGVSTYWPNLPPLTCSPKSLQESLTLHSLSPEQEEGRSPVLPSVPTQPLSSLIKCRSQTAVTECSLPVLHIHRPPKWKWPPPTLC